MDPLGQARARQHTYDLFARLFLRGPSPEELPHIRAIPELSETIPGHFDLETTQAEHYRLFGLNVFPYASIFLSPDLLVGGAVTESVLPFFRQAGLDVTQFSESPDHAGRELALLASLCGAEADALEAVRPPAGLRIRDRQRRFLNEHLLRWLPALVQAIRQQGNPFYTALAELTLAVSVAHSEEFGENLRLTTPFELPEPPPLLDDPKTGLKQIAGYLATPAYSGFFLSRDDVTRLGRAQVVPRGFGDRKQMLANLLRTAADYDRLGPLLHDLQGLLGDWRQFWGELTPLASVASVWAARLELTEARINQIYAAVEGVKPRPPG